MVTGLLIAGGCAHKKHLTRAERAAIEAAERQRVQDSIEAAELKRLQELEYKRVQDSIAAAQAAAEAARRAMVQTLLIPRMTLTLVMQGRQFTTPASMRWQRAKGAMVSVQPIAGIEMIRIELDEQALLVIDKINRRYTQLTYADLEQMGFNADLNTIDGWVDEHILSRKDEPQLLLQLSRDGMSGSTVIYTNTMQVNANVNLRPTNVELYRQVTLEQLIKGI